MKNIPTSAAVAVVVAAILGFLVTRQESSFGQGTLEQRVAALESGHLALQQQIQELRAGLQNRPAAPAGAAPAAAPRAAAPLPETIRVGNAPRLGRADAQLTIVEFSDFECPFCGRYHRDTFPQLKKDYIDSGRVSYVYRDYPLERIHPRAMKAAEAGQCAHRQGKFWPLHDILFVNQQRLTEPDLATHAQAAGVDMTAFRLCMGGQTVAAIRQGLDEGARGGITGTPGFFIGTMRPDGNLTVLRRIVGAQPFANFKRMIDELLVNPRRAA